MPGGPKTSVSKAATQTFFGNRRSEAKPEETTAADLGVAALGKVSSAVPTGVMGSAEAIGAPHPRQMPSMSRDEDPHWLQNTTSVGSVCAQSLPQIYRPSRIGAEGVPEAMDIFDTLLRL